MSVIQRTIQVGFELRVFFTQNVFAPANPLLNNVLADSGPGRSHAVLVVVDESLALFEPQLRGGRIRVETRVELARLHRKLGATMVYVTHDQSEALTLGDRIAVLKEGVLQQVDTPMKLYEEPANKFVAGFIGSPGMNFFEGVLTRIGSGGMCTFQGADFTIRVPCQAGTDGRVVLGIRPQHLEITDDSARGDGVVRAEVGVVEPMGNEQIVYVTLPDGGRGVAVAPVQPRIIAGEKVSIRVRPEGIQVFEAGSGKRLPR